MHIRVKKANGHNLNAAEDKVSLINYISATLFSQIDISLNGFWPEKVVLLDIDPKISLGALY